MIGVREKYKRFANQISFLPGLIKHSLRPLRETYFHDILKCDSLYVIAICYLPCQSRSVLVEPPNKES